MARKQPAAASPQAVTELLEYQLLRPYRIPMSQIRPAPVNPNQFKITIVGPNDLREATMRLIADFAAQNPAVKVKQ